MPTKTYTSPIRSAGTVARAMLATWVARNEADVSRSSTANTSGVPAGSVAAIRPASVPARRSSGDMNGVCSFWAIAVGHAIRPISATVMPIVSQRRGSVRSQIHVMPHAARIGRANPNVMIRSGGNHRITSASGTASRVKASHAARNRRANRFDLHQSERGQRHRHPRRVAPDVLSEPHQVGVAEPIGQADAPEESVTRGIDRQARGSDQHGCEAGEDHCARAAQGGHDAARVGSPAQVRFRHPGQRARRH